MMGQRCIAIVPLIITCGIIPYMKARKVLVKVLSGSKNVRFGDFVTLLEAFGFELKRIKGSHHIFKHPDVPELLSVQPSGKQQAKPYQMRQFLKMIEEHNLKIEDEDTETE
jgi:predicted RNA binding protein YcfA (HicA-like mRNA interferase family)